MAIEMKEMIYKSFGRCLEISNAHVALIITLDIGPRIISYSLCGKENLFFEDINNELKNDSEAMQSTFGKGKVWNIYGGHRLWISPEYISTYYPDNEKITYKKTEKGVLFTPPVQDVTGLLCELEVILEENSPKATINHYVTNHSGAEKEFAPWALTVMDKGGIEFLEWNTHKNGWLSNRNLILWDYTNIADARATWGEKYFTLRQDENAKTPFKIGIDNRKGFAAYVNKGVMFVKKFTHFENETYPDNGCSFETYTNGSMLEIESLGSLKKVKPNEKVSHIENWEIVEHMDSTMLGDEKSIEAIIEKYKLN